jgi:hypothetical protein
VSSIKKLPHSNAECRLRIAEFNLLLNYKRNWDGLRVSLEESQNKDWGGCPLFFIRGKDQDIERLKRGGCYEREKQRGKGKQEGAAEKPQREEKGEEREEEQVGLEEALEVTS